MATGNGLRTHVHATKVLDWGVAGLALAGEAVSGDLHLVKLIPTGALVAVVDGLGHGADAATAARAAVTTLGRYAHESLLVLIDRCHQALLATRGAVISLANLDSRAGTMTWLGVGNVEGILQYAAPAQGPSRASLVARGGIVGRELPPLRTATVPISPGDTLLFASDGIKSGFADSLPGDASPQQMADQILATHGKGTDDALILVARYLGAGA